MSGSDPTYSLLEFTIKWEDGSEETVHVENLFLYSPKDSESDVKQTKNFVVGGVTNNEDFMILNMEKVRAIQASDLKRERSPQQLNG